MKNSITYWLTITALVVITTIAVSHTCAASTESKEYQIKAAFLYNFIMFVDWPSEKMGDKNQPIILGIIGSDPFENAFDPVKDKLVKDKKVAVKRFKGLEELKTDKAQFDKTVDELRKCHLLFICRSEHQTAKEIVDLVKDYPVLTAGDMQQFLVTDGGMINFVIEQEKVRFEINNVAANNAKLHIRSQLLRLAKKVIDEKPSGAAKD